MYLRFFEDQAKSHPMHHVVDVATHFQVALYRAKIVQPSGTPLCVAGLGFFVGDPDQIVANQSPGFTSEFFKQCCESHVFSVRHTPTE